MELTFVHQYSGDPPKRRRLVQACVACRTRKKRCVHFAGGDAADISEHREQQVAETEGNLNSKGTSPSAERFTPSSNSITNGTPHASITQQSSPSATKRASDARFISDLNPEAALLNRPVPSSNSSQKLPNEDIGVWVDRAEWDALLRHKNDGARLPVVLNQGFRHTQRPHSAVLGPLIDIYFEKVHPILPLLDEDEFRRNHTGGIVPEALVHAMCLVAAKDRDAEPYLKLSDSPATVSARQFCSLLHESVTSALRVPVRFEKVMLIRILALTSLHCEGPEGADDASILLSQAMHHAQTLCIHLGQEGAPAGGNELRMKRLFWCLWALDRSNSAMNGRPIIMADIDIAIETFAPGESGYPAFEAWLKIAAILNKIIGFYRPTKDLSLTGWEGEYPGLEKIIDNVHGWTLSSSLLATIHLFYLAVGILSHRTRGVREMPCGIASNIRQRLFAIEIVRLMNSPTSPALHPLPLLPYAISLALSVSYQHLRQSQLEHQQVDALQDFRSCYQILQTLRPKWCSADVMATLAKKVLDELDRTPDLAVFRIRRTHRHGQSLENAEQDIIPPPSACRHDVGSVRQQKTSDTQEINGHSNGSARESGEYQLPAQEGVNLFNNMDDVFDTFMDPNYPLNFGMSFVDDLPAFDWNGEIADEG